MKKKKSSPKKISAKKPAAAASLTAKLRALEEKLRDTERKLQEALAKEHSAATTDPLTRLANRHAFYAVGDNEMRRTRRYRRPMSLAYLDLDNFKVVNDTLGAEVGDALLVAVAALIRAQVRSTDFVARLGDDEFGVLLPEAAAFDAEKVLSKVHASLQPTFDTISARLERAGSADTDGPTTDTNVGCSIAIIALEEDHKSFDTLVRAADRLMISLKHRGKNRVATAGA